MPDEKFDRKHDRQAILSDFKQRLIDLMENHQALPDTGIYDEPVRYFKANLKWTPVIFGWLTWLEDLAGWIDAEDELYSGIQAVLLFEEGIEPPIPAFPSDSCCDNYAPSAAFIRYIPQNPYNQPDYIPPDYLVPPFFVNSAFEYPAALGYLATDVFINPASFTIDPIDLITLNLPRIEIDVKGTGQVEIDFLGVEAGSVAICKIGSMPNIIDIITGGTPEDGVRIIDLNKDIIAIPPELDIVIAEEFDITADPDVLTTIYIVFMPVIDDSLIPLAFGGGIRLVGLCAFEGMEDTGVEAIRFVEETCSFEQRINGEWQVIEGNEDIAACFGGSMATKDDIRDGMYEAINRVAKQIVSGRYTDIIVDDEGNVSDPGETDPEAGLPEDDPETEINEARSAAAGGAIAVRLGFNEIWTIVSTMFAAGDTAMEAEVRLTDTFLWEDPAFLVDFLADYWAARTAAESFVAAFTTVLDAKLYCKGNTKLVLADWIYETFSNESQKDMALYLKRAIAVEQMNQWYSFGTQTPSTAYIAYSCTPAKLEEFTLDMSLANFPQYTTNAIYKANHRILIEVSGSFVDSDVANTLQDYFYTVNTSTGAKTFLPGMFQISHPGIIEPSQALVPYEPSHSYAVTIDITGSTDAVIIFGRDNDTFTIPNVAGILTFKITDLGEYSL